MTATAYRVSAVSAASPDMRTKDFEALVADIREHGQLVPIRVCGDEIIDGRKRFAACERLGIKPIVENVAADQKPEEVSRSLNILRTHYTTSQRAMLTSKRVNATKGGRRSHGQIAEFSDVVTAADAAAEGAVGIDSVRRAKRIRRTAAPEVVSAVEAGKLTLHTAGRVAKLPKNEQPAALARVLEASKGKRRNASASVLNGNADRWAPLAELIADGNTSQQIARKIGVNQQTVRKEAKRRGLTIRADEVVGKHRRFDPERVLRAIATDLNALAPSCAQIGDPKQIASDTIRECLELISPALKTINRFQRNLKETIG